MITIDFTLQNHTTDNFYSLTTFQGQKERQRNGKFLNQKMILEKVKDDPGP